MSKIKEELEQIDYSYKTLVKAKTVIYTLIIFVFTIIFSFPFEKKLDSIIYSSISSIPGCPISFKDYKFELFSPKIVINKLNLDKRCFGNAPSNLKFDQVLIKFRGLSFSPFGPSFKIETKLLNNPVEAFIIPGFTSLSVLLENESENGKFNSPHNKFHISDFNKFIPSLKLAGELVVSTAYLKMGYNGKLKDLALNIASKDFFIPEQKIMGFRVSKMVINKLLLQMNFLKNDKIRLKKLIIGDDKSPLIANFAGDMNLNLRNFQTSSINLKGELSISEEMQKNYLLLKIYLDRFDKKDKFYQIQIKGKLNSPEISTAR